MTRELALEEAKAVIAGLTDSHVRASFILASALIDAQRDIDFLRSTIDEHRSFELSLIATCRRLDPVFAASPGDDGRP